MPVRFGLKICCRDELDAPRKVDLTVHDKKWHSTEEVDKRQNLVPQMEVGTS